MLRRGHLEPGQMVLVDQYVSALHGRLPHTKGKEPKKDKYCGGTIFVDHVSTKMFVKNQVSLNAAETVMAKKAFEREAMTSGVRIRGYHRKMYRLTPKPGVLKSKAKDKNYPYQGPEHITKMELPREPSEQWYHGRELCCCTLFFIGQSRRT
jgi:hypothetical protein